MAYSYSSNYVTLLGLLWQPVGQMEHPTVIAFACASEEKLKEGNVWIINSMQSAASKWWELVRFSSALPSMSELDLPIETDMGKAYFRKTEESSGENLICTVVSNAPLNRLSVDKMFVEVCSQAPAIISALRIEHILKELASIDPQSSSTENIFNICESFPQFQGSRQQAIVQWLNQQSQMLLIDPTSFFGIGCVTSIVSFLQFHGSAAMSNKEHGGHFDHPQRSSSSSSLHGTSKWPTFRPPRDHANRSWLDIKEGDLQIEKALADLADPWKIVRNTVRTSGLSPLHLAAALGNVRATEMLLALYKCTKNEVIATVDIHGNSALHAACLCSGCPLTISLILETIPSCVNLRSFRGWHALEIASTRGLQHVCKLLVAKGAVLESSLPSFEITANGIRDRRASDGDKLTIHISELRDDDDEEGDTSIESMHRSSTPITNMTSPTAKFNELNQKN